VTAVSKHGQSGATGGSAMTRGSTYQTELAVLFGAEQMLHLLGNPLATSSIALEPRLVTPHGATRWDIGIRLGPDGKYFEAKVTVRAADVMEWLRRVGEDAALHATRQYRLVYSSGDSRLLQQIGWLASCANEASDEAQFDLLVAYEGRSAADEIRQALGPAWYSALRRLKPWRKAEPDLAAEIEHRLTYLVGPGHVPSAHEYLFHRLQSLGPERLTLPTETLVTELRNRGLELYPPPMLPASSPPSLVETAAFILQRCPRPLPVGVLAGALGRSETEFVAALEPWTRDGTIVIRDAVCRVRYLVEKLRRPDQAELLSCVLEHLLDWIEQSSRTATVGDQSTNAVALAHGCSHGRPRTVARVFSVLDKILKRKGDKALVLDVARLSEAAARRVHPRGPTEVRAQSRALICGIAWTYQRTGQLGLARAAAEQSHHLAGEIDDALTAAFCTKCLGRLCRIEAESLPSRPERAHKLAESVRLLQNAASQFRQVLGVTSPEVADCLSLLARTWLVGGDVGAAEENVRKAYDLADRMSKDYFDLLILDGDIHAAKSDHETARALYSAVLERDAGSDAEISEIRARALLQRALSLSRIPSGGEAARRDLAEAGRIWHELGELDREAAARWELFQLEEAGKSPPKRTLDREGMRTLLAEPPYVRMWVVDRHRDQLAGSAHTGVLGQRSKPSRKYWRELCRRGHAAMACDVVSP
jgi:tetratricopeptide (TPR) repeat protein